MSRNAVVCLGVALSLLGVACSDPVGVAPAATPAHETILATFTTKTVLTNGGGNCGIGSATNCFTTLSDGTYTWLSRNGYVVLYYPDGTSKVFTPFTYTFATTGTNTYKWTGKFRGVDEAGVPFLAYVYENMYSYYSRGGGGKGGGGAGTRYAISSGKIVFWR